MSDGSNGEAQFRFEAPPPPQESGTESGELNDAQTSEKPASTENRPAERPARQEHQPPAQPIILPPAADDTQAAQTDDQAAQTAQTAQPGKEVPVVEKQWVDKAKAILSQNRDDPFVQKKEMSDFKADYIKKRFNKTIPRDDAVKA